MPVLPQQALRLLELPRARGVLLVHVHKRVRVVGRHRSKGVVDVAVMRLVCVDAAEGVEPSPYLLELQLLSFGR